jgi:hypothetical protein
VHRYCDPFKRRQICAGRLWRCEDSLRIALRCHLSKGMFLFHVSALRLSETFSAPHPPTSHCQCQQPLRRYTAKMCLRLGSPPIPSKTAYHRPLRPPAQGSGGLGYLELVRLLPGVSQEPTTIDNKSTEKNFIPQSPQNKQKTNWCWPHLADPPLRALMR